MWWWGLAGDVYVKLHKFDLALKEVRPGPSMRLALRACRLLPARGSRRRRMPGPQGDPLLKEERPGRPGGTCAAETASGPATRPSRRCRRPARARVWRGGISAMRLD